MPDVPDILRRICEQRRRRVAAGEAGASPARRLPAGAPGRRFLDAIRARRGEAVIAEIKMGSPKLGDLRGRFDPIARASAYAGAGAACLSVVVEPDHFFGSYDLLAECAAASGLPAVAKDFVVSDVQLAWARDAGACAVLLIAALHDAAELRRLAGVARGLGLVPLVETHDGADFEKLRSARSAADSEKPGAAGKAAYLEKPAARKAAELGEPAAAGYAAYLEKPAAAGYAADLEEPSAAGNAAGEDASDGWELVGINNRDLRTFAVDLDRSAERVGRLPRGALKVAESGIHSAADLAKLRRAGFDAFLIGERLVLSGDPAAALAELLGASASSAVSSTVSAASASSTGVGAAAEVAP